MLHEAPPCTPASSDQFEGREVGTLSAMRQGLTVSNVNNKLLDMWTLDHREVKGAAQEAAAKGSTGNGSSAVGSRPPSCLSKCGTCKPCTPVRIPVPPGTPTISEYYPEAWRCKCGGKLYMP
ncbi:hypothetical protein GOP47_0000964 [Adiantum capillus-veneris]|uniref:Epidermal patterning factor-like protein n=1 Tax=Adiantum capillus-veneris TaxID=13818 RepID=A0A9D4VDZ0_ADICA|nr:hypothetical protein GOP47_0000964 [Adiantum capillus-veneris]